MFQPSRNRLYIRTCRWHHCTVLCHWRLKYGTTGDTNIDVFKICTLLFQSRVYVMTPSLLRNT